MAKIIRRHDGSYTLTQEQYCCFCGVLSIQGECFLILPAGLDFNPTIPDSKLTKNNMGQV